jgi:hypothetical protein
MALGLVKEIRAIHEDACVSIAFDCAKRAVYTAAEGDKAVKVGLRLKNRA